MEFETEVDISFESNHDQYGNGGKGKVKWKLDFEARSWGISSLIIIVPEQKITFDSWFYDEETDEETQKEVTFELKESKIYQGNHISKIDGLTITPERLVFHNGKSELVF